MLNKKLKSFGLIEAMLSSLIVVLVLSAAVAIASSSLRNMLTSDAYREAEHISGKIMSEIEATKTAGQLDFSANLSNSSNLLPVNCFDTVIYFGSSQTVCRGSSAALLPYTILGSDTLGSDGFVSVKSQNKNFPDGYFSFRIKVGQPKDMPDSIVPSQSTGKDFCRIPSIPGNQCRFVEVDVKWNENIGQKNYFQTDYFTNWEK